MRKIMTIIRREYNQAVRKKSFLVLTILGPILMAALIVTPAILATRSNNDVTIAVLDESNLFQKLNSGNDKEIHFKYLSAPLNELKEGLVEGLYNAVLYIPYNSTQVGGMVYTTSPLGSGVMSNILAAMKQNLTDEILTDEFGIDQDSLNLYIAQQTDKIILGQMFINEDMSETQQSSYVKDVQQIMGMVVGIIIYFFIFMYCSMVLRGVLEEKSNRVVEIIVSSVKPVQLMIGKIVGIALIGITQLLIWVVLLTGILTICKATMPEVFSVQERSAIEVPQQQAANYTNFTTQWGADDELSTPDNEVVRALQSIDYTRLVLLFIFFFITGYFLYASLYAAVGAAVDNDTDTQQFTLPLTIPLILMIVVSSYIISEPDGPLAFWCSIIPFTAPIAMLIRIPFGAAAVQDWEILLSCALMLIGCMISVKAAAKIYRTGILMYGKKITYKELWKWIRFKE